MHASRNIRLCTKDCLCLYVCPTGASDTENGQIDFKKCIGCGRCVKACVSHAIAMIPDTYEYPPRQKHEAGVASSVKKLAASKAEQEQIEEQISRYSRICEPYPEKPFQVIKRKAASRQIAFGRGDLSFGGRVIMDTSAWLVEEETMAKANAEG
mgnify:CR=1 FL=1